jgi:hypothetical protein
MLKVRHARRAVAGFIRMKTHRGADARCARECERGDGQQAICWLESKVKSGVLVQPGTNRGASNRVVPHVWFAFRYAHEFVINAFVSINPTLTISNAAVLLVAIRSIKK